MCSQDGIAETLTLREADSCFVLLRQLGVNAGAMTDEGSMIDEFWHLSFFNRMLFSVLKSKNEG